MQKSTGILVDVGLNDRRRSGMFRRLNPSTGLVFATLLVAAALHTCALLASPISVTTKGSNGGNGACGKHGHNGDDIWSSTKIVQANSGSISASAEPAISVTGTGGTGGHGSSGNCSLSGGKHGGYGGGPISLHVAGPDLISTTGTDAYGVLINLATGGGGSGGDSNYGDGGNGGDGDKGEDTDRLVTVVNNSNLSIPSSVWSIHTTGNNASGIQVNWYGGDGGAGNRGSGNGGHGGAGGLAGAINLGTGSSTNDVPVQLSVSTTGSSAPAISLNAIDGNGKGGGEGVGGNGGNGGQGGGSGNPDNSVTQIFLKDTTLSTAGLVGWHRCGPARGQRRQRRLRQVLWRWRQRRPGVRRRRH